MGSSFYHQGALTANTLIHSRPHYPVIFPPLGISQYIQEVQASVCDLERRLQRTKDNVHEIQSCMRSWATPMFNRKEDKKHALLNLEDRAERVESFYSLIRSSGEKFHILIKVVKRCYSVFV